MTYTQRDAAQTGTPNYSNLGPKWTHQYFAFVTDDPALSGANVRLATRGGGYEDYTGFVPATQTYVLQVLSQTLLKRLASGYERSFRDGSKEFYEESDGATSYPRKWYLTRIVDPVGNSIILTYGSITEGKRLLSISDAIGQATTLSYELPSDPLRITKVTDPFARFATFTYDGPPPMLSKITDVIGMVSEFGYATGADADRINAMITPYGTTTFASALSKSDPGLLTRSDPPDSVVQGESRRRRACDPEWRSRIG